MFGNTRKEGIMKNVVAWSVLIVCACAVSAFAQNKVVFDNQSGEPALVKLVGPTPANVEVPSGNKASTDAAAGRYIIKVRYGTAGKYRYTQGEEFQVAESATTRSEVTITLHKVVGGNYDTYTIPASAFDSEGAQQKRQNSAISTNDQQKMVSFNMPWQRDPIVFRAEVARVIAEGGVNALNQTFAGKEVIWPLTYQGVGTNNWIKNNLGGQQTVGEAIVEIQINSGQPIGEGKDYAARWRETREGTKVACNALIRYFMTGKTEPTGPNKGKTFVLAVLGPSAPLTLIEVREPLRIPPQFPAVNPLIVPNKAPEATR